MYEKEMFQRKLISVLFEILKDNFYDYLDETMITQEIKLQNRVLIITLASFTVALNKFVFLAFERQKGGLFLGACFPRKS